MAVRPLPAARPSAPPSNATIAIPLDAILAVTPRERAQRPADGSPGRVGMAVRPLPAARPFAPTPKVTIAIPPIAVPTAVHVHEAAPAIITRHNAGHVGMTAAELLRVLRAMAADPRFRGDVIRYGKTYRGARPEAIEAYLRAAPPDAPNGEQDESPMDLELLDSMGYEPKPRARGRR